MKNSKRFCKDHNLIYNNALAEPCKDMITIFQATALRNYSFNVQMEFSFAEVFLFISASIAVLLIFK